ncbi:hypothetical protein JCM8547_003710 [Rhodosporidiobolus lusitaniae]
MKELIECGEEESEVSIVIDRLTVSTSNPFPPSTSDTLLAQLRRTLSHSAVIRSTPHASTDPQRFITVMKTGWVPFTSVGDLFKSLHEEESIAALFSSFRLGGGQDVLARLMHHLRTWRETFALVRDMLRRSLRAHGPIFAEMEEIEEGMSRRVREVLEKGKCFLDQETALRDFLPPSDSQHGARESD